MPMIDAKSSDYSCIYTTLSFDDRKRPLLEQVYAENTVPHILSGKTCALEGLKIAQMYDIDLSPVNDEFEVDFSERFLKNNQLAELAEPLQKTATRTFGVDQLTEESAFREHLVQTENFYEHERI